MAFNSELFPYRKVSCKRLRQKIKNETIQTKKCLTKQLTKIKLQRQPTATTELQAPDFNKNVDGFKHGCDPCALEINRLHMRSIFSIYLTGWTRHFQSCI